MNRYQGTAHSGLLPLLLSTMAALLSWSGCHRGPSPAEWIEAASQANQVADHALAGGDAETARDALTSFLESPTPDEMAPVDRRILLQDVAYRLAQLEIDQSRPEPALRWAEHGLSLGLSDDVFTANLYVAQGRALEMLGRDREAAGAYFAALRINEVLLRQSLGQQEDR